MKKIIASLTILNLLCLTQLGSFATCPLNSNANCSDCKTQTCPMQSQCESCCEDKTCNKFFPNRCAFDTQREKIYSRLCLNETQVCQIQKLDDEYALRFKCYKEKLCLKKQKLCELEKCSPCSCEAKELKNDIRQIKKECKCERNEYEKRFLCLLSDSQKRDYKRIKKEMHKCNKALDKARKKCNQCN